MNTYLTIGLGGIAYATYMAVNAMLFNAVTITKNKTRYASTFSAQGKHLFSRIMQVLFITSMLLVSVYFPLFVIDRAGMPGMKFGKPLNEIVTNTIDRNISSTKGFNIFREIKEIERFVNSGH